MIEGVPLTAQHRTAASRVHYCWHDYTEPPSLPDHAKGAIPPQDKLRIEHNDETKRQQYKENGKAKLTISPYSCL